MKAREELIAKIKAQPEAESLRPIEFTVEDLAKIANIPRTPSPIVSLEDFFEGNDDIGSIAPNLIRHPGTKKFYEVLKGIRARDDVQDVFMEIGQIEEEDPTMWPLAENVYILTSASADDVRKWMVPLMPDQVFEGWSGGRPSAAPDLKPGIKVYGTWWD